MIETPDKEKRPMTPQEIISTLSKQQSEIKRLTDRVQELDELLSKTHEYIAQQNL